MDAARPVLVLFHGGAGGSPAERLVAAARVQASIESITHALDAGIEHCIVATDDPTAFGRPGPHVTIDCDRAGHFDFGERLRDLVARYSLEVPVVMGSGSLPLLGVAGFASIVAALDAGARCVTNNLFSGDLTAWRPGAALATCGALPRDNVLPRRLRDSAGLPITVLPRTTATTFDIDTPADLTVLRLCDGAPSQELPAARYREVMRVLTDPGAELAVCGRVSSTAWQYLETETACRVRLLSEERGLAAAGPQHRARSTLGFLLEAVGIERFFSHLSELGDAIVLDTRVLEAHLGLSPSREDRFQSDLLAPAAISDPFLRAFTEAAVTCPAPVILGGHSLVSGGLMAMTDLAWAEEDARKAGLTRDGSAT
jgi:hypothetical protein